MSEESIIHQSATNKSFDPEIIYNYGKGKIKFKGNKIFCLLFMEMQ